MSRALAVLVLSVWCFSSMHGQTATTSPAISDPSALTYLSSALTAVGGLSAIKNISDFSGSGTATIYAGEQPQTCNVTLQGRGATDFRFDCQLSSGTQSWAVLNGVGTAKAADGTISTIPIHNAVSLGALTFPFVRIAKAASSQSYLITDQGLKSVGGQQFRDIRIHLDLLAATADPDGSANKLLTQDYFFDPSTNLLVGVQDETHPVQTMTIAIDRSVYFSDYRNVGGVLVPFQITQYIGGQKTWTIQLANMSFNTGLTDSTFQIQ